jgi:hypothetical protein
MTLTTLQRNNEHRVEDLRDPIWPARWLRLLLTYASLALSPALAAAQIPTVPASAAPPDDGQWTMPSKNYASTRYSALDEINSETVKSPIEETLLPAHTNVSSSALASLRSGVSKPSVNQP